MSQSEKIEKKIYDMRDASLIREAEGYIAEGWGGVYLVREKVTSVGSFASIPAAARGEYRVAIKPGRGDRVSTVYVTRAS